MTEHAKKGLTPHAQGAGLLRQLTGAFEAGKWGF